MIAAAVSEPEANIQDSSLISNLSNLQSLFEAKCKELWSLVISKAQGIVVTCMHEWKIYSGFRLSV